MTEISQTAGVTLVLGGNGKTGSRVAQRLTNAGVPVRIGSRVGSPQFDWQIPSTWDRILHNVTAAYIAYSPDTGFSGAAETIAEFAHRAIASGTRRLVLLSGRGEKGALHSERSVRDSGAEWTIIRSSFFAQNFSEDFLADAIRQGVLAFPFGHVAEPFIDVEDIADIATAALTQDSHCGQVYEVTGPHALTFVDAIAKISTASGRQMNYQPITTPEFEWALVNAGAPADFAAELTNMFTQVLDGRNTHPTDGVQRALGRPARSFVDFAWKAAAAGAWK